MPSQLVVSIASPTTDESAPIGMTKTDTITGSTLIGCHESNIGWPGLVRIRCREYVLTQSH
jgi:hypothetical protein